MKTMGRFIIVLAVSMALCGSGYAAGQQFSIGSGMGFSYPFGDLQDYVDLGFCLNGFAQWTFNDYLGVRSILNYQHISGDDTYLIDLDFFDLETDLKVWNVLLDAVGIWDITNEFSLSGMAGMGVYIWDSETDGDFMHTSSDGTNLGFNVGGNAAYVIVKNISLQATILQHVVDLDDWVGTSTWTDFIFSIMVNI